MDVTNERDANFSDFSTFRFLAKVFTRTQQNSSKFFADTIQMLAESLLNADLSVLGFVALTTHCINCLVLIGLVIR